MPHRIATPVIPVLLAAGLAGCASLPQWSGIAPDSPANPHAQAERYTPPTNPFVSALAPIPGANSGETQHNGMMPGMPGMMNHKGMMAPGMMKDNGMKHDGKKPDKKNGGAP